MTKRGPIVIPFCVEAWRNRGGLWIRIGHDELTLHCRTTIAAINRRYYYDGRGNPFIYYGQREATVELKDVTLPSRDYDRLYAQYGGDYARLYDQHGGDNGFVGGLRWPLFFNSSPWWRLQSPLLTAVSVLREASGMVYGDLTFVGSLSAEDWEKVLAL